MDDGIGKTGWINIGVDDVTATVAAICQASE